MVPIFITSWNRPEFTKSTIDLIRERTAPGSYSLHCYDNGSDIETKNVLLEYLSENILTSLLLDNRNTGCLYNKLVFHSMVEGGTEYYCVTDNDVVPSKLSPDWLAQMIAIMNRHPSIALLTPQVLPQFLQMPYSITDEVVYCHAVGNTFKIARRSAIDTVIQKIEQKLGAYGDDGLLSKLLVNEGWKIAFCRNIFALHKGQCENWGYTPEQVAMDPRKQGYGKPYEYEIQNTDTYEPVDPKLRM